jgi:hypothetical protein
MAGVLTESSTVKCAHQGTVKLTASQSKLTVGGKKVLVEGDLTAPPAQVSSCATVVNQTSTKCLMVSSAMGGVAQKLKVGGKGVLLESVQGQTSGVIGGTPQTWSVQDAGQTKLKAV